MTPEQLRDIVTKTIQRSTSGDDLLLLCVEAGWKVAMEGMKDQCRDKILVSSISMDWDAGYRAARAELISWLDTQIKEQP